MQARRQEFPEGGSLTCIMSCEPGFAGCYYGRGSGVFTAASCNLAISRHFILTYGKLCFFYKILDFISHRLNKTSILIFIFYFSRGEGSYETL